MARDEPLTWSPVASLRSLPPARPMSTSPPKKTAHPVKRPAMLHPCPVDRPNARQDLNTAGAREHRLWPPRSVVLLDAERSDQLFDAMADLVTDGSNGGEVESG